MCILSNSTSMMAWATLSGVVKLMSLVKKEVKVLGHHSDAKVNLIKFSPSDVLLVSGSSEGCIKVRERKGSSIALEPSVILFFIDRSGSREKNVSPFRALRGESSTATSSIMNPLSWCAELMGVFGFGTLRRD